MRVGIVGCGVIAKLHIKHLLAQGHKIVGVADIDRNRAEEMCRKLCLRQPYEDLSQLLEDQKPGTIHITTPPSSHAKLSIQALEAGCHVLVEKPMALTISDADKMIEVAQQQGRMLSVGHTQHFVPVIQKAYKLFEQGKLGKVLSVEAHIAVDPSIHLQNTQRCHWKEDLPGGLCYDLAPHAIYPLLPFTGKFQKILPLVCKTGLLPLDYPDEIQVLIEGDKAIGMFRVSLNTQPPMCYLNVYGTKMSLRINLTTMMLISRRIRPLQHMVSKVLYHCEESLQIIFGICNRMLQVLTGGLRTGDEHGVLIRKFYDSIESGAAPPVPPEEGREVSRVLEAIWGSKHPPSFHFEHRNKMKGDVLKCFVTGANGFIGRHLVKSLVSQGHEVQAFVRRPYECHYLKELGASLIEGDLKDADSVRKAIQKVDVLYHLGATTKGKKWQEHFETTVLGTQNVLEAAKEARVGKVVYISSLGVYDKNNCRKDQLLNEDWPIVKKLEERGPYVRAKVIAEQNVWQFYKTEGLPITIIRPGLVYGPGGPVFFPHIGHKVGSYCVFINGNGQNFLPFVYIENLVDAVLAAGTKESATGRVYHIVDREKINQDEYLEKLMAATNWKPIKIHIPWGLLFLAAGSLELCTSLDPTGKLPKTTLYLYVSKSKRLKYDTTRAQNELGWQQRVNLKDGLDKTFEWHKSNSQRG